MHLLHASHVYEYYMLYELQTTFQMMHDQIIYSAIIFYPIQTTNAINSMGSLSIELPLYIAVMGLQH